MRMTELTKYQKSRMCLCLYCHQQITENQEFEFCTTKFGKSTIYTFIHSDCMVKAKNDLRCLESMTDSFDDGR